MANRCRELFGPSLSCLFKASVFQMFEQDADGCISARHFLMYLSLRSAMIQMVCLYLLLPCPLICAPIPNPMSLGCCLQRVHLSKFDPTNCGVLTEQQLEDFLEHFSETVPALDDMPVSGGQSGVGKTGREENAEGDPDSASLPRLPPMPLSFPPAPAPSPTSCHSTRGLPRAS